jgi:hypothetical protein
MITLEGFAVKEFLQGYLTCESSRINSAQPTPMGLCTLQGRVLANGWALELDQGAALIVHSSLAADVVNFLRPYAMFAKCTLGLKDVPIIVQSSDDPSENFLSGWSIAKAQTSVDSTNDISDSLNELMIKCGVAFISKPCSQKFLPQMLNLHLQGAVDFDKGCYLGQEIVARAQFRGEVKKQLSTFHWYESAPEVGTRWQDSAGVKGDIICVDAPNNETVSGTGLWVVRKPKSNP